MTDEDGTKEEDIHFLLHKARNYMNYVAIPTYGEEITTICQNKDAYCAQWALDNWCETDAECKFPKKAMFDNRLAFI